MENTPGEMSRRTPAPPSRNPGELESRICELEELITRIPMVPTPLPRIERASYADSPFEDHITLVDMPEKFVLPPMHLFDGTSDPDDHVAHYKQRMFAVFVPRALCEVCMCKGFGSSLSGPALQCYTSIPNSSIGSFAGLHAAFVEQFASSRKIERHSDDLCAVRQDDMKTLRAYVARFNKEKVSIPGCNLDTTISDFRRGLRTNSNLYKELTKYPCRTMDMQIGEMAGIAIGITLLIGVLIAGPISGGSMNPSRTIGPAVVLNTYTALWVYIVGPVLGTLLGGFVYNLIRFTDKPLKQVAKNASATFLKSASRVF